MSSKVIICLSLFTFSCLLTSCKGGKNFTRKDCQNGVGYDGYLKGYYAAKNNLQRKSINSDSLYDYCYSQGYLDALG